MIILDEAGQPIIEPIDVGTHLYIPQSDGRYWVQEKPKGANVSFDQMFEVCSNEMRKEKNRSINADYLSEEVSDRFGIFDSEPGIIIPDWIGTLAKAWLLKQDWFVPDADETFWTK